MLGFVVCNTYAKELQYVIDKLGLTDLRHVVLAAICAQHKSSDLAKFELRINNLRSETSNLVLMPENLCSGCSHTNQNLVQSHHPYFSICTEWFLVPSMLQYYIENHYYIVTPGWLRQWKYIVCTKWGFTAETARLFFSESAKKILVLNTGIYEDVHLKASAFSDFCGLPFETLPIGLEYFEKQVEAIYHKHIYAELKADFAKQRKDLAQKLAEYSMIVDLIQRLSAVDAEDIVIGYMFELLTMFFAPGKLVYVSCEKGNSLEIKHIKPYDADTSQIKQLCTSKERVYKIEGHKGLVIKVSYSSQDLGFVIADDILLPNLIPHYLQVADILAPLFGLLMANVIQIQRITQSEKRAEHEAQRYLSLYQEYMAQNEELKAINEELNTVNDSLNNANSHLKKREDELAKLNATKDKFFSIISHDLRSPMSSLYGTCELLKMKVDTGSEAYSISQNMGKLTEQTMNLLENLLNWAQLQSGKLQAKPRKTNLKYLVNEVLELMHDVGDFKNISLKTSPVADIEAFVDEDMIKTVLRNLVSNAIKFTYPYGEVRISSSVVNQLAIISVTDTGVGIRPELVEKLFKVESNETMQGTANERGSGLGLILCKEFVEKNGGTIWLNTELGKGSSFSFSLPTVSQNIHANIQKV